MYVTVSDREHGSSVATVTRGVTVLVLTYLTSIAANTCVDDKNIFCAKRGTTTARQIRSSFKSAGARPATAENIMTRPGGSRVSFRHWHNSGSAG